MKDDEVSLALRIYTLMQEQDSVELKDAKAIATGETVWVDGHFSFLQLARDIIKANS